MSTTEQPSTRPAEFEDHRAITEAVQRYLDGARVGDAELVRSVFYPQAIIAGVYADGELSVSTADEFEQALRNIDQPSPDLVAHIASIDITGTTAVARVEIDGWLGARYTDYLTFLKHKSAWRIAAKSSHGHGTPTEGSGASDSSVDGA